VRLLLGLKQGNEEGSTEENYEQPVPDYSHSKQ
jgi:hypothetical protein